MAGKTLGAIVLSLALGLSSVGCGKTNEPQQKVPQAQQIQPQYQTENISGKIVSIDEDSFAIGEYRQGANFEFEHFRIEASDGKTYKLIFPGPSNYQVGDMVNFQYRVQSRVSYRDLFDKEKISGVYLLQSGFFDVDGLIQR